MAEIDLYKFRGFKIYTPELPDAPATPLYDIVFWLSGIEDDYSGLIRCNHYDAEDYTDGEWPVYYKGNAGIPLPALWVQTSSSLTQFSSSIGKLETDTYEYFGNLPTGLTTGSKFAFGTYISVESGIVGNAISLCALIGSGYNNKSLKMQLQANGDASSIIATVEQLGEGLSVQKTLLSVAPHYLQVSYTASTKTMELYVDGVSAGTQVLTNHPLCDYVQIVNNESTNHPYFFFNSLIVSADPAINFYTEEYAGTPICDLTEYPTAIGPTISIHPQSEEIFEGQSFSELTVAASSNGGGTLTYQWQSYTSSWADIEGETTDAYTPTSAGTYRCAVSNDVGTTNSNSAVLSETEEIDYMEYATNGAAQAAYVSSDDEVLQSYSEATIKTQGSYSLKGVATTGAFFNDEYATSILNFNGPDESTTFTDETGKTWTGYGGAQLDTAQKVSGTSSLYLDGDAYIDTPDTADHEFGSGDFTIEYDLRYASHSASHAHFGRRTETAGPVQKDVFSLYWISNVLTFQVDVNEVTKAKYTASWTPSDDTWYTFAIVRHGTDFYIFVNGTALELTTVTAISTNDLTFSLSDEKMTFGRYGNYNGLYVTGWYDRIRITKGLAKYTSNYTPTTDDYILTSAATLTYTFSPALNFTGIDYANFNLRSTRTGSNIKLGLHDTGGTTTEVTPNITDADTFQTVTLDLSVVSDANKNAIDSLIITIVNADSENTFYIDDFKVVQDPFAHSQTTTISHASEPTDQQVMFTINRSTGTSSDTTIYVGTDCKADYSDIRFYCDDVLLDYWIEEYTSSTARIWVKFPEITSSSMDLVIKYGNSEVTSASDISIFDFYDDGSGTLSKWDDISGTWTVTDGKIVGSCSESSVLLLSNNQIPLSDNYVIEVDIEQDYGLTDSNYQSGIAINYEKSASVMKAYWLDFTGYDQHIIMDPTSTYTGSDAEPSFDASEVHRYKFIKSGTSHKLYVDDVLMVSYTYTWSTAPQYIGFHVAYTAQSAYFDNLIVYKYLATAPTIGSWSSEVAGDILFGTHFDSETDWNTSQNASLLTDWDQKTADNEGGGTYEAGYIAQHGESSGKCLKQYWDTGTSTAQNCWLIKNSISIPDEFWLGYRFKVDTNWDWGSATSLKIMKLHYDNGTTLDINWCSSHYEMPSPYTPPGGGYSIATDATGKNWFGHWTDIDDGAWHTFVWHFKHSTNTLECFVDGTDAALTSETPAFPGTGWDDGSVSGYALSFGGNLSGGGGGVDEMYTKYDDVCIGTTRAKVEEYLGI